MRTVKIASVPGTQLAENKDDARRLREKHILPALEEGQQVELDFSQVEFATQSFVHALISEAIRRYGEQSFDRIKFVHCTDEVKEIVLTVFEYTFAAADAAAVHSRGSPERGYRAPTVCKLVGITYRQLDYWARTGLVTPSVRAAGELGSQRLYSFTDVVELRIIKRLLDAQISLQHIRRVIGYLRDQGAGERLTDVTLMSDGQRIYACHSDEEVVDVLSHGQAVFGIAVERVWADTEDDLAHLPAEERAAGIHVADDA